MRSTHDLSRTRARGPWTGQRLQCTRAPRARADDAAGSTQAGTPPANTRMEPPHSRRVNLPLTMVRVSPTLMPPCICAGPPGTSFVTCPVQVLFHQLPRFAARSLTGMPSGSVLTCRLPDGEGSSTAPMPTIESPDIFPPVFSADFVLARCTPRLGVAGFRAPIASLRTGFLFFR